MNEVIHEAHSLVAEAQRIASLPDLLLRFIDGAAAAWVIISGGRIALFNRKAVFMFGWQPEHVIGKPVEILLPERLRERHAAVLRPGYERDPYTRPMGANLDLLALHRDGTEFSVTIDLQSEMSDAGILFTRAEIRRKGEASGPGDNPHGLNTCPVARD